MCHGTFARSSDQSNFNQVMACGDGHHCIIAHPSGQREREHIACSNVELGWDKVAHSLEM